MKAEQIRTGRDVAVKLLHPHIAAREDFAARFMREVKVATLFDHPHIVRVYDVGETDNGSLYLVMELLDGDELKDIIKREAPLSTGRVLDLGLQMVDGLAEAHSRDVVHRDFKPSNVFICTTRRGKEVIKLLDFGIAKLVNSGQTQVTATGSFTGTPSYMAPEVMVDAGETNQKAADVYAAGLVLLEMLTGQRVFDGNGIAQTLLKHLKKPVLIPEPIVRTPLGDVLRRATAKHPDDRFPDGDALYAALEKAQDGTPRDLILRPDQIPAVSTETSPSLLKKMATQGQTTNLEMLRDMPQHAAYTDDGTPPSLPELPSAPDFGVETAETLRTPSVDVESDDSDTDRVENPNHAGSESSMSTDFSADPTEIYSAAEGATGEFDPEPTRAEIPSNLPDSPDDDAAGLDEDFGYEPTRAEIPANLPGSPDDEDSDDKDDEFASSGRPRFDIPSQSERAAEATLPPQSLDETLDSDDPQSGSLNPHIQAIKDDPKKLAALGASVLALLFIIVATPIVLLDSGTFDDSSNDDSIAAASTEPSAPEPDSPEPEPLDEALATGGDETPEEDEEIPVEEDDEPTTASLQIESDPSGASLWIDDEEWGTTTFVDEFSEEDWPTAITLKKEGYEDAVVDLDEFEEAEFVVTLEAEPEPEPEPEPAPSPPPRRTQPPPSPTPAEPEEDEDEDEDDSSSLDHLLDQHLSSD